MVEFFFNGECEQSHKVNHLSMYTCGNNTWVITTTQIAIEEIRFIALHKGWVSTKILKVWVILHHCKHKYKNIVIFAGNSIKKKIPPTDSCTDIYQGKNITAECLSAVWCFNVLHLITTWCNVRKNHSFTGRKGAWGLWHKGHAMFVGTAFQRSVYFVWSTGL